MRKPNFDVTWLNFANALKKLCFWGFWCWLNVWILYQGHAWKDIFNFKTIWCILLTANAPKKNSVWQMLHEKGLKLGEFEVSNSHKIGKFESFVYFFHSKCTSDSIFWEKQDRDFFNDSILWNCCIRSLLNQDFPWIMCRTMMSTIFHIRYDL